MRSSAKLKTDELITSGTEHAAKNFKRLLKFWNASLINYCNVCGLQGSKSGIGITAVGTLQ